MNLPPPSLVSFTMTRGYTFAYSGSIFGPRINHCLRLEWSPNLSSYPRAGPCIIFAMRAKQILPKRLRFPFSSAE